MANKATLRLVVCMLLFISAILATAQQDLPPKCVKSFEFCIGNTWRLLGGTKCYPDYPTCETCNQPNSACSPRDIPQDLPAACPASDEADAQDNANPACQAAQPINVATGNTYIQQSDISIPGIGGGLKLIRTWNSVLPTAQKSISFMFGSNWRSNYEDRLILNSSDGYMRYAMGNGQVAAYGLSVLGAGSSSIYERTAPSNHRNTVTGDTVWTLALRNGSKRIYDISSGLLTSIVDRNGNTTTLTYDSNNRLTTVTDPAGRHLTFTYVSPSSSLVANVSSDVGISVSYSYDTMGRLTKVTKADNSTVSFDYDTQSMITAVRDSDGKILESHTYDVLGRGLTASRANGVDSVTVTYPQ